MLLHPPARSAQLLVMVCAACSALRERSSLCCCIAAGARQLFVGDAETGRTAFQLLYAFILEQVRRGWNACLGCKCKCFLSFVSHSCFALGAGHAGYSAAEMPDTCYQAHCYELTLQCPVQYSKHLPAPPLVPLQVVLSPDRRRLDALPIPARQSILALAAAFLPYYCNREVTSLPSFWRLASGCA